MFYFACVALCLIVCYLIGGRGDPKSTQNAGGYLSSNFFFKIFLFFIFLFGCFSVGYLYFAF